MTSLLFLLPALLYFCFLLFLLLGSLRLSRLKPVSEQQPISIIVAARNEEANLPNLLRTLAAMNYPQDKYEIIIADDRSTDKTPQILESYKKQIPNLHTVRIQKEKPDLIGKKNALDAAIRLAKNDILAFTDADCIPHPGWLQAINLHMQGKVDFLAGYAPLRITGSKILAGMKNLERTFYFAIAQGSFGWKIGITCTASNLVYRKSQFLEAGGFSGIGHIRSGDDDLMMLKLLPYVRKMNYMTIPQSRVTSLYKLTMDKHISLETRRASKFKYYPLYLKLIALAVFLFYIYVAVLFVLTLAGIASWQALGWLLLVKTSAELALIVPFLFLVRELKTLVYYPMLLFYYPIHFLIFALKGTFGSYKWKEA